MNPSPLPDEQDVVLFAAIQRRWVLILSATIIASALAFAFTSSRVSTYTSSARVLLHPLTANPLSSSATASNRQVALAMTAEAALINSADVVGAAGKKLGEHITPGTNAIRAKVATNTEVLVVSFRAATAMKSRAGAQVVADSFLRYRSAKASAALAAQLKNLQHRAKLAQAGLGIAVGRMGKPNPPPDVAARVNIYAGQLTILDQKIAQVQAASTDPGAVSSVAAGRTTSDGFSQLLAIAIAAAATFAAATALAVWRGANDKFVRAASFTAIRGRPVLTTLAVDGSAGLDEKDLRALRSARVAQLRAAVLADAPRGGAVIVVAGVSSDVPAARVATDLGMSLRDAGHDCLVADAGPISSERRDDDVGSPSRDGGAAPSEGEATSAVVARHDPADQFAAARFRELMGELRTQRDFVVVAGPPTSSAEGVAVAFAGDRVVLCVADAVTLRSTAHEVIDRLGRLRIDVIGFMITASPARLSWLRRVQRTFSSRTMADHADKALGDTAASQPADRPTSQNLGGQR
jgi:capsular polysaccharide biosynthesis protein